MADIANYDNTAGYRLKVLGQQVLLFNPLDPTGRTVRWNPLSYINRHDPVEVINELQKIAAMLYPDPLTGEKFHNVSAYLTFVALGSDGKAREIPPVEPQTDAGKRRYQAALRRRASRVALAAELKREELGKG